LKQLGKLFGVALSLLALISCDSSTPPESEPLTNPASTMQFQLPKSIRTTQAINLQATGATLQTSVGAVDMVRVGDRFEGSIRVARNTTLTYDLAIYEQVGNQIITYVVYSGATSGPVTGDQTIPIFESNYIYPDDDRDGASNLAERAAGSDHANPLSTPNDQSGSAAAGEISFVESSGEVEEGQPLRINVNRAGGSNGMVSVTVQSSAFTILAPSPTTLVWANGDSQPKTILVRPEANVIPRDTQTVQISLSNPTGGATLGLAIQDVTVTDITSIQPPVFTGLATDGEWEVCSSPYNTAARFSFATQLSVSEGRTVSCFKPCTENVILHPTYDGLAWMPSLDQSCFLTQSSPGSYAKIAVYTPAREQMTLNLTTDLFTNTNNIWRCDKQNRNNIPYTYEDVPPFLDWYQFNDDGTYNYATTADGNPPVRLQGPSVWNAEGRTLDLANIDTRFRNIIYFPGNQMFHIHPDADNRIRCTLQPY